MKDLENHIVRDKSCLTNNILKHPLIKIKDFPVFFGCVESQIEEDLKTDMEFFIEKETGLIQLNKLIPLDILYQKQHAFGVGNIWDSHYKNFAEFISKGSHKNVIEIGGATERLANKYLSVQEANWTIVEPNPSEFKNKQIKVIKGFFEDSKVSINKEDTIVFSHVLEHVYDPRIFLKMIYDKIVKGQNLYFSYPRLEIWLEKKYTNALNFEHTLFLTEPHLDILLENIGFEIEKKSYFQDHSIFYKLSKVTPVYKRYPNIYERNKTLFDSFIKYHFDEVKSLNQITDECNDNIFLFGAHIFSQFLIVLGLNTNKIKFILDNSKEKQNKRLYGTELKVKPPTILKNIKKPTVILRAANYNSEIKEDILKNINPTTIFI